MWSRSLRRATFPGCPGRLEIEVFDRNVAKLVVGTLRWRRGREVGSSRSSLRLGSQGRGEVCAGKGDRRCQI